MEPRKPKEQAPGEAPGPSKIEVDDLPLEEGSEADAERIRGGTIEMQDVMVTGVRPRRP